MSNNTKDVDKYTFLTIENNILKSHDVVIQLSSICQTKLGKCREKGISGEVLLYFVLGCVFFGMGFIHNMLLVVGIGLIIYSICVFAIGKEIYCLMIELNSGSKILFECDNKDFLNVAHDKLIECINSGKSSTINFTDCKIIDSQIGENNSMQWRK